MIKLCKFLIHHFHPVKVFPTYLTEGGKVVSTVESWHGKQCIHCNKRKIKRNRSKQQSTGATQDVFDWLNAPPAPPNPSMIKVIQK